MREHRSCLSITLYSQNWRTVTLIVEVGDKGSLPCAMAVTVVIAAGRTREPEYTRLTFPEPTQSGHEG